MAGYETFHWRLVTIMLRLFGIVASLLGMASCVYGISLVLRPASTVYVEGIPTSDLGPKLMFLVVGPVFVAIGVAFMRVRPYRPDLGDVSYLVDPFGARGNALGPRRWWTGDPSHPIPPADA
jgi:hypothetical protein